MWIYTYAHYIQICKAIRWSLINSERWNIAESSIKFVRLRLTWRWLAGLVVFWSCRICLCPKKFYCNQKTQFVVHSQNYQKVMQVYIYTHILTIPWNTAQDYECGKCRNCQKKNDWNGGTYAMKKMVEIGVALQNSNWIYGLLAQ